MLCIYARSAQGQMSYYHDSLRVSILDTSAWPTGNSGGIVTTNNATANSIFTNFNVSNAIQLYPSSSQQYLRQVFLVICNCNEMELMDTLNSYPAIFWGAQPIPKPQELGIANTSLKQNIRIYPNPAADHVTVATSEKVQAITVRDMSGRIVAQQSSTELDVHALAGGNYFLTVQTSAGSITEVLSKQ
jgi:hypothetical protein